MKKGIEVPFVEGDEEGLVTQEIILSLQRSGFDVVRSGSYILHIESDSQKHRSVGYGYRQGEENKLLDPQEETLSQIYKVSLLEQGSNRLLVGPDRIRVTLDYDFSVQEVSYEVLKNSMGQLQGKMQAKRGAQVALGRILAQELTSWLQVACVSIEE